MTGKGQEWHLVRPRQVAMYLARRIIGASYAEIGARIGGRNHSTALHSCRVIKEKMRESSDFRRRVGVLVAILKQEKPEGGRCKKCSN